MKSLSRPSAKAPLGLYRVMSDTGLVGTFGSKFLALKAMRGYNAKLKAGERPVWVTHGPDHWRAKVDSRVPKRPSEPVWQGDGDERTLTFIPSAVYWL